MGLKNRLMGVAAGLYAARAGRAERVARAEFGTARVADVVLLPATSVVTRRLVGLLAWRRRDGDTWRGRLAGRAVSVVNTGIGTPSAEGKIVACLGIGARVLLRVDICGGLDPSIRIGDVIIATEAVPFDGTTRFLGGDAAVGASPWLIAKARAVAANRDAARFKFASMATVDTFHFQTDELHHLWGERAQAVDMETSAIYYLAREAGAHALTLATVSDVRLAGLDPFGDEGIEYGRFFQGIDDVVKLAVDLIASLPAEKPPLF
jgi:purine-nucleoside phosphorylase